MNTQEPFPATLAAAHERIAALRVAEYARTRNALDGAVTRLSPYITHGFVSLPEVLAGVAGRAVPQRLSLQHKFVCELGWREFFQHLWQHRGSGILADTHPGPLPAQAYTRELPADIRQARTGVPGMLGAVVLQLQFNGVEGRAQAALDLGQAGLGRGVHDFSASSSGRWRLI